MPNSSYVGHLWSTSKGASGQIYCESCWRSWGRYVKPGCKYELSSACEDFANRFEVELVYLRRHQPFKCKLCNKYFNQDELEAHVLSEHVNAPNSWSLHEVPVIRVSGCSDPALSPLIQGEYTASKWFNGKPVYRKTHVQARKLCKPPVVIYYSWEACKDEYQPGWWFGTKVGDRTVWAYHEEVVVGDMLPPTSGWRVPWDGAVDQELKITADPDPESRMPSSILIPFLGGAYRFPSQPL